MPETEVISALGLLHENYNIIDASPTLIKLIILKELEKDVTIKEIEKAYGKLFSKKQEV